MGNDLALAVLSDKSPPLFDYFKQLFAQVTNPPIDPIRESIVMSLSSGLGAEQNLLDESPEHAHQLHLSQPVIRAATLERLRQVDHSVFWAHTVDITWPTAEGPAGLERALARICEEAEEVVEDGVTVLILSDRKVGPGRAAVPALLAVAAVHHHLVRAGTRLQTGLVVETGEARSVSHFAALIGYGAAAVCPYLMFESVSTLAAAGRIPGVDDPDDAENRVVKAIGKGLLKTMSKMGISTISSYCGAQIFEAVGLAAGRGGPLLRRHGVAGRRRRPRRPRPGGAGAPRARLPGPRRRCPEATDAAYNPPEDVLPSGGQYQWRRDGERRQWDPKAIAALQKAARTGSWESYEEFAEHMNSEAAAKASLRGLMDFAYAEDGGVPLDEVEPAAEIVKRFATGAMSLGLAVTRGARDARHRHEPDRRQVELRRGRGGRLPLRARRRTATTAAPRSTRSRPAASASTSTTSSTATSCRSRWPRAPSPARAASCPARRSTTTSAPSASPRRA